MIETTIPNIFTLLGVILASIISGYITLRVAGNRIQVEAKLKSEEAQRDFELGFFKDQEAFRTELRADILANRKQIASLTIELESTKDNNSKLSLRILHLESQLKELTIINYRLLSENDEYRKKANQLEQELNIARANHNDALSRIKVLEQEVTALQNEVAKYKKDHN